MDAVYIGFQFRDLPVVPDVVDWFCFKCAGYN